MGLTHDIWARCGKGLFLLKGGTPPVGRLFGSWQSPAVSCRGRISAAQMGKQLWIDDPPLLGRPDAAGYETMRPESLDSHPQTGVWPVALCRAMSRYSGLVARHIASCRDEFGAGDLCQVSAGVVIPIREAIDRPRALELLLLRTRDRNQNRIGLAHDPLTGRCNHEGQDVSSSGPTQGPHNDSYCFGRTRPGLPKAMATFDSRQPDPDWPSPLS